MLSIGHILIIFSTLVVAILLIFIPISYSELLLDKCGKYSEYFIVCFAAFLIIGMFAMVFVSVVKSIP